MSHGSHSRPGRTSIVVGLGEVGGPLRNVLARAHAIEGVDIEPRTISGAIEFLHVCYPGDHPAFVDTTAGYAEKYSPEIIVIHSTVPVGTTRRVAARTGRPCVFSPVRGKHARMEQELTHYVKFIGADDATVAERTQRHFEQAGMKARCFDKFETVELAKLTETTYFGLLIAFAQDVERMAASAGVSYEDVITYYEEIGYLPRVKYFPGVIGGHCVMPNIAALKQRFSSPLLDAIEWSNAKKKADTNT